jgi:hypothetical protein
MSISVSGTKITIHKGDDGTVRYTVQDQDDAALDVSAATFKFSIKEYTVSTSIRATLQTSPHILPVSPGIGVIDVSIPNSVTESLGVGEFMYDLQMTLSSKVYTLVAGVFKISQDVTPA